MAVGDICTLLTKFFVEYLDIQGRKYYIQYNVSLIDTYCHACEEGWGRRQTIRSSVTRF